MQKAFKQIQRESEISMLRFHILALNNDKFESHREISLNYIHDWANFLGLENINRILAEFSSDETKLIYLNGELICINNDIPSVVTKKEMIPGILNEPRIENLIYLFEKLSIPIRFNIDFGVDFTLNKYLGGIE